MQVLWYTAVLDFLISIHPLIASAGNLIRHIGGILDGPAMFLIALLDSSFLSIPEGNDILIVGLSIGKAWSRIAYYVAVTAAGSITGCLCLYAVGRHGGSSWIRKRISPVRMAWLQNMFRRYGMLALVVPCILPPPCPFKVFVLSAGVFGIRLPQFIMAITLGRLIRYSTWGVLAFHYGESVRRYMASNLPAVGIALLSILAAGLMAAIVVFYMRRRTQRTSAH